jgi:hypothetical protein
MIGRFPFGQKQAPSPSNPADPRSVAPTTRPTPRVMTRLPLYLTGLFILFVLVSGYYMLKHDSTTQLAAKPPIEGAGPSDPGDALKHMPHSRAIDSSWGGTPQPP